MNKEHVKGRLEEAKGKVKEVAGHTVGNKHLEQKGQSQKNRGKAQADAGDRKEDNRKSS